MQLVTYLGDGNEQLAGYVDGFLYDIETLHPDIPGTMSMFLNYWDDVYPIAQVGEQAIRDGRIGKHRGFPVEEVQLMAPVPFPTSCRDGYAFGQHVAAARRNRKVEMIPEF